MGKTFYRILLSIVITSHHIGLWTILASVPMLIIKEPIWISLPLCAWIMHLGLNRLDCPYTRLENNLRRKLGLEEITTFISHYYKKPYHRLMWAIERKARG
tara:strand:- start:236 stop:538 length:303 start_codon:yes stop_codon:yes gene_type:complete